MKIEEDYVTNKEMNIKVKDNVLSINLIQDSIVMEDNLLSINKDIKWLNKILKKNGYKSSEEVFLFIYKNDSDVSIYGYEKRC